MNKILLKEINRNREIMGLKPILEQDDTMFGVFEIPNDDGLSRKEQKQKEKQEKIKSKEDLKLAQEINDNDLYDWNYELSGPLNWIPIGKKGVRLAGPNDGFLVEKIGFYRDRMGVGMTLGLRGMDIGVKEVPTQEPGTKPTPPEPDVEEITLPEVNLAGASMPYPDNMVKPYFDRYPQAKNDFSKIVDKFKEYIKAGGIENLNNITIQGTADSGTPNRTAPSGFSKIDHDYGGSTNAKEMNLYLAEYRAYWYAEALKEAVKEKTGQDIKINVLDGISYLGQDNKRGEEWRTITLTPNAPPIKPKPEITTTTTGGTDGTEGRVIDNREIYKKVKFEVYYEGRPYKVDGIRWITKEDNIVFLIKNDGPIASELPNGFDIKDTAEISPDLEFKVGGTSYGRFSTTMYDIEGKPEWGKGFLLDTTAVYPNRLGAMGVNKLPTGENGEEETWIAIHNMTYQLKPMKAESRALTFDTLVPKPTRRELRQNKLEPNDSVYRLEDGTITNMRGADRAARYGKKSERMYTDDLIEPNLNL